MHERTTNMKYRIYLIVILCGLLLPVAAQPSLQQQKDSLRHTIDHTEGIEKLRAFNKLCYLYMSEVADDRKMDTLQNLFRQTEEEAIKQGNAKIQGMVYGNTIISYINRSEYDKVIEKAPAYLDFYIRHEQWRFYYQIHMQLVSAYNFKGEYEPAAEEAKKMYGRALERKDKAGMATALYATAITYNLQKRWKEEEDCFRECISLLWEVTEYDNILTQAYAFLCMSLRAQERYDEVLQLVPEYEKAIDRFEKASGRSQPEARGNLYVALMNTYIDIKAFDQAETYLSKLENIVNNNISQYELARARALIALSHGDYEKALATIDSAMMQSQNSEFDLNYVRKIKMEILARMGRNDEAFGLLDKIIASNDSIKDVEVNTRFDELRTQYEVEKHITEKERNFHYFLFTLGICLILVMLLAGVFYYNRVISTKNRKLYERIKEQDRLTEELFRTSRKREASSVSTEVRVTIGSADNTTTPSGNDEQLLLVARMREYLLSTEYLSNNEISREEITVALGTNKNTLNEAVRVVTGKSLMEYMRALQIEEVRRILDEHPELTVEAAAYSCGFNTPSTFYRLFKKQYGLTPVEYRKMAKSII